MAGALWLRNIYDGRFTDLMRLDFWDAVAFGTCNAATGSLMDVTETNRDINIPTVSSETTSSPWRARSATAARK